MKVGMQNRVVAKNQATRIFDYSVGRAEIAQEMETAENNLLRYKMRVKEKKEREKREA